MLPDEVVVVVLPLSVELESSLELRLLLPMILSPYSKNMSVIAPNMYRPPPAVWVISVCRCIG